MKNKKKYIICGVVFLCIVLIFSLFRIKQTFAYTTVPDTTTVLTENNMEYEYNSDLFNILILGIDVKGNVKEDKPIGQRGQADVIFVVSIDTKTKDISILSVPRDTMVNVVHYDVNGNFTGIYNEQITLQHAIGSSEKESCEIMAKTVSQLLNGIPIHKYVAISYDSIPVINDAIGGVDLVVDEENFDPELLFYADDFIPGKKIHLDGYLAHCYVRIRDLNSFDSAEKRLNRQRGYIKAYIDKTKSLIKKNPFILFSLYTKVNDVMETNLSVMDLIALLPYVNHFSFDTVYTFEGERIMGKYVEFHVPEEELFNKVKEIYYRKKSQV